MKTSFLFGHGDAKDNILPPLKSAIERHIEYGVTEFVVGRYGGFDMRAARILAEIRKDHPHIRLLIMTPYYHSERHIVLPCGFDGFCFPDGMEKSSTQVCYSAGKQIYDYTFRLLDCVYQAFCEQHINAASICVEHKAN